MKFTTKLIISLSVSSMITLIVGIIIYSNLTSLISSSNLIESNQRFVRLLSQVTTDFISLETGIRGYLLTGDDEYLKPFSDAEGALEATVENLIESINVETTSPEEIQDLVKIKDQWMSDVVVPAMLNRKKLSRGMISREEFEKGFKDLRSNVLSRKFQDHADTLLVREQEFLRQRLTNDSALAGRAKLTAFWGILLATLISLFIVWKMGQSLNTNLRDLFSSLFMETEALSDVSNSIFDEAQILEEGSEKQFTSLIEMTTITDKINCSAQDSKKSLTEFSKSLIDVHETNNRGKVSIDSLAENVNRNSEVKNQFNQLKEVMNSVRESCLVINNIVSKTQMLSFNASIESARAGAHGKGFAIIADEIRKLAELSGQSALSITKEIDDSEKVVDSVIQDTVSVLDETNRKVEELNELFTEISNTSDLLSEKVSVIETQFSNQEDQIKGVVNEVFKVETIAQDNQKLSTSNLRRAKKLSRQRDSLIFSSQKFSRLFLGVSDIKKSASEELEDVLGTDTFLEKDDKNQVNKAS